MMPIAVLALAALLGAQATTGRLYHIVALKDVAVTSWTHVCTSGPVVYVRRQRDGDVHITLDDGTAKVVLEIIPLLPVPASAVAKGHRVRACGIARLDRRHGFAEIHPVEWIEILP
jgi:hypothetical protein